MSETVTRTAVLECGQAGCATCARIARREFAEAEAWSGLDPLPEASVTWPGDKPGHVIVVPVTHIPDVAADPLAASVVVKNAGEYAEYRDFPPYDVAIRTDDGHLCVEITPRQSVGAAARRRLGMLLGEGEAVRWVNTVDDTVPAIGDLQTQVLGLMEMAFRRAGLPTR